VEETPSKARQFPQAQQDPTQSKQLQWAPLLLDDLVQPLLAFEVRPPAQPCCSWIRYEGFSSLLEMAGPKHWQMLLEAQEIGQQQPQDDKPEKKQVKAVIRNHRIRPAEVVRPAP
jgi:hypothetical protein